MPQAAVYQAIQSRLETGIGTIPFLGAVYAAPPKVANESDLVRFTLPGNSSGAAIYLMIEEQSARRIAFGGPHSGRKERPYILAMFCVFRSDAPTTTQGQADFSLFIDGITNWIEADRTADSDGVIFQWGEGTSPGTPDIQFAFRLPFTLNGGVTTFHAVGRVTVLEISNT